MNRRELLLTAAAGTVGLSMSSLMARESFQALDIIDCHTHFYDPTRPQGVPWPGKNSSIYRTVLPHHLRELKQFRPVTGTVIVEASAWVEDNAWLLDLAKDDPFVVGIVGRLTPGEPEFASHLKRFSKNPLYRGIRISSRLATQLLDNKNISDLQRLADHDLSLDVNGGPDTPAVIARIAEEVPDLRIVLNHIGNVHITDATPPQDWVDGIQAAASHPNVYSKISALKECAARNGIEAPEGLSFYRPYIDVVWNAFGDDRVIYGSNWPVSERASDYESLQRVSLGYAFEKGRTATEKFCSLNAKQAYKWIERPGRRDV
ncbi:amidohydrolase family protein [Calycomorphotria hydatis]|uniref:Amidohydrolase n=1 Tax=Calycomorphotria hydatis TaxID=2528027 RepID=A0A517T986_9PLAN|nr:amidohydrolase family protein [Calycomorphotria hydatis]QDT64941.1 Amidohydrolase [Calycomorphotria hydatis]